MRLGAVRWPGRERAPGPSVEVLEAAGLARGERVLGSARGDDGSWLLGTRGRLAVVLTGPGEAAEAVLVPWEQVEDAGWDSESSAVRVRRIVPYGEESREWRVTVTGEQPVAFLQLLRERVTASVVVQRKAPVAGRRGVVVACRRSPTGGPLRFDVVLDPGLDPDDPLVREAAEDLLSRVRSELGELA